MEVIPQLNFSSSTILWGWNGEGRKLFFNSYIIESWLGTLLIKTVVQIAYNLIGL